MLDIESLKKLKENSIEVNKYLQDINKQIDSYSSDIEGMTDITQRVKKAFNLYKTLVNDMEEQLKKQNN
jgi:hypothetical protein